MVKILIPRSNSISAKTIVPTDFEKYFDDVVNDYIISGFTVTATIGINRSVDISTGTARVKGMFVNNDALETTAFTFGTDNTHYLYIQLTRDGNNEPESWSYTSNTTGTPPTDSIVIAKVITAAGDVSSVDQTVEFKKMNHLHTFVGTGAEIAALTTYSGMIVVCTVTGSGFRINNQYVRNTANTSWNIIPPGGSVNTDSIIFSYDETIGNYTTPTGSGVSSPLKEIEYLVIGGGGGGGGWIGGGGGAGAYRTASIGVSPKTYTITVGTGGAGGRESYGASLRGGRQGTSSSIIATDFDITSDGGGGGSYYTIAEGYSGNGSSGGANSTGAGAYGNNGSSGGSSGGGGAGAAASSINGGAGLSSSITGSSVFRGGGGGGAGPGDTTFGSGGNGGGGGGAANTGTNGTANTGGGGGSSTSTISIGKTNVLGGDGGSGVVIIRYTTGQVTATGGTITTSGAYTIHSFTSSGSFVITATTAGSEAIDNNTSTKWTSSSESNPNIYVDMGSSIICSHIAFVTSSTSTAVTIQVQTSTDSITYTTVRTLLNANLVTNGTTYNFIRFNADDARYLRLRCSDATAKILSMNEIKVLTISTNTALVNHGHNTIDPSDTSLGSNGF